MRLLRYRQIYNIKRQVKFRCHIEKHSQYCVLNCSLFRRGYCYDNPSTKLTCNRSMPLYILGNGTLTCQSMLHFLFFHFKHTSYYKKKKIKFLLSMLRIHYFKPKFQNYLPMNLTLSLPNRYLSTWLAKSYLLCQNLKKALFSLVINSQNIHINNPHLN